MQVFPQLLHFRCKALTKGNRPKIYNGDVNKSVASKYNFTLS